MASDWQPIGTAPKDRRILCWCPNAFGGRGYMTFFRWDNDELSRRPRPFWHSHEQRSAWSRENQPTLWMDIKEPTDGK